MFVFISVIEALSDLPFWYVSIICHSVCSTRT